VTPDLLPTPFRYLSDALPLAQAVNVARSVAYFHDADIARPTLLMLLWAAIAAATVAIAWRRQSRTSAGRIGGKTRTAPDSRIPASAGTS
jgi:hypothetical protein